MKKASHYLIIGNGRVAKHMQHYFRLRGISFATWMRDESFESLDQKKKSATHILLLITDQHIEEFSTHLQDTKALMIHFSGSLVLANVWGAHPLMTFDNNLFPDSTYEKIPFVLDEDAPAFETLFPDLPNPNVRLNKNLKAKYHALCVLSGNFSCMLWQKFLSALESEFNLPPEIGHLYLQQQTLNLLANPQQALTGPLVRNDHQTIAKNLNALVNDPYQEVYKSFLNCHKNP